MSSKVEKLDAERDQLCKQKQAVGNMEAVRKLAKIAASADVTVANNDAKECESGRRRGGEQGTEVKAFLRAQQPTH